MTIRKEEVLELVRQLPDEVDIEELIYRLYIREKGAPSPPRKCGPRRPSGEGRDP